MAGSRTSGKMFALRSGSAGAIMERCDHDLLITLQTAISTGSTSTVAFLLSRCSTHVVQTPLDEGGTTLLHLAANCNTPAILQLLLDCGANPNVQNDDGYTALHVAAIWGKADLIILLLEHGADPTLYDFEELLPVDHARNEGHEDCARLLEEWSPSQCSEDPLFEQSMAETFVSMFVDDLTSITPISTPSSSPVTSERLNTPVTHRLDLPQEDLSTACAKKATSNSPQFVLSPHGTYSAPSTNLLQSPSTPVADCRHSVSICEFPEQSRNELETQYAVCISNESTSSLSCSESLTELYTTAVDVAVEMEPGAQTEVDHCNQTYTISKEFQSFHIYETSKKSLKPSVAHHTHTPRSSTSASPISVPVLEIPSSVEVLSDEQLRKKLIELGETPGPVNQFTRSAYKVYLAKILAGIQPAGNVGYKGYKYELALVLNGTAPLPDIFEAEQKLFQLVRTPSTLPSTPRAKSEWTKTHFNYLLLDPRGLGNLQQESREKEEIEVFRRFVDAIFYVGKGKNARPLQHLKDAQDYLKQKKHKVDNFSWRCCQKPMSTVNQFVVCIGSLCQPFIPVRVILSHASVHCSGKYQCTLHTERERPSAKLEQILEIWSSGYGVVSLHLFNNTTAQEAFSREACMIEAIGLERLTNIQRGHPHGEMLTWPTSRRRHFGVYLLHKAFRAYLVNTPKEVFKDDL